MEIGNPMIAVGELATRMPETLVAFVDKEFLEDSYHSWKKATLIREVQEEPEVGDQIRQGLKATAAAKVGLRLARHIPLVGRFIPESAIGSIGTNGALALQCSYRLIRLTDAVVELNNVQKRASRAWDFSGVPPATLQELCADKPPEVGQISIFNRIVSPMTQIQITAIPWRLCECLSSTWSLGEQAWEVVMRGIHLRHALSDRQDAEEEWLRNAIVVQKRGGDSYRQVKAHLEKRGWTIPSLKSFRL